MVLKEHKGYWTIFYYDRVKKYTRKKSTGLKATQQLKALAKDKLKKFQLNYLKDKLNFKVTGSIKLSEGLELFFSSRELRPKTQEIYKLAVDHFIEAVGDKEVNIIDRKDYAAFIKYVSNKSQNSRSIWTRHLRSLWNYFLQPDEDIPELKYAEQNIIKVVPEKQKPPKPILDEDLTDILNELKKKITSSDKRLSRDQYYFVAFILNTGVRISTALEFKWEDINWGEGFINLKNVKINGNIFQFPLTEEVLTLLKEYGIQKTGKVFPYSSTDSIKFWYRTQKDLKLEQHYGIHRTRKTFLSKMARKIPIDKLSAVTDTDPKTLRKYYVQHEIKEIGKEMDAVKVYDLGDSKRDSKSGKAVPDRTKKTANSSNKRKK